MEKTCSISALIFAILCFGNVEAESEDSSIVRNTVSSVESTDYRRYETDLGSATPGVYEFGDKIYFVQQVITESNRNEHISQELLWEETLNAISWVKRQATEKAEAIVVEKSGTLGKLIDNVRIQHIAGQAKHFMGTGQVVQRNIRRNFGRSIVAFSKNKVKGWVAGVELLDELNARKVLWKSLEKSGDFSLMKDISAELNRWDDYVIFSYYEDKQVGFFRKYSPKVQDPILIARLAVRAFSENGVVTGLSKTFRESLGSDFGIETIASILPRLPYSRKQDAVNLFNELSERAQQQDSSSQEFARSVMRLYESALSIGAYSEAKEHDAFIVYYAKVSGGFLQLSSDHGAQEESIDPNARRYFRMGRTDKLSEMEVGFTDSVRRAPTTSQAWLYLGQTYSVGGKWLDALSAFRMGLLLEPENVEARKLLKKCYEKLGYPALAKAMDDSVLERT